MKRFLLSLAVLATAVFGASAETLYTLTFGVKANQPECNQYNETWTLTQEGLEWTITGWSNNNNVWSEIRYGASNASKVSDGYIISNFAITGAVDQVILNGKLQKTGTKDKWKSCKVQSSSTSDFAVLTNDVEVLQSEFSKSASDVTVTLPNPTANQYYRLYIENNGRSTNNGWFALQSITFNGTPAEASSVATPVITVEKNIATITCETEGAVIYYTLDGSDPTTASTEYTEPIQLETNKTTTIKAIAIKGDESSNLAQKTVNVPMILEGSLSELVANTSETLGDKTILFDFTGTLTYVYQEGNYLYLTDGVNTVKFFGYNTQTYTAGDTFASLNGTYSYRYGQPQITNFTLSDPVAGSEIIKPVEISDVSLISKENDNKWYTIKGVEIKGVSGTSATMVTADGKEIALYNDFGCEGFEDGTNLTVSGIVGLFNENVQLLPTEITDAAGEEIVEAPVFSHVSGAYPENTVITISCATEGATIVYTVNDGEAIESQETVTLTLTEAMSVKAYATKEGYAQSATVSADYTVKVSVPGETTATFNFNDLESLSASETLEAPVANKGTNVTDVIFTAGNITLTNTKPEGSTTTDPRLWYTTNGIQLRLYAENISTFEVVSSESRASNTISQIIFNVAQGTADNVSSVSTGKIATDADKNTIKWVGNAEKVEFTWIKASNKTPNINSIDVIYNVQTGIESVEAAQDGVVEYYNLQGMRIANPAQGQIVIRRQGNHVEKVIF